MYRRDIEKRLNKEIAELTEEIKNITVGSASSLPKKKEKLSYLKGLFKKLKSL